MKRSSQFLSLLIAGGLSLAGSAFAQSATIRNDRDDRSQFSVYDADQDGRISRSEFARIQERASGASFGPTNRAGEPGVGESALSGHTGRPIGGGYTQAAETSTGTPSLGYLPAGSASRPTRSFQQLDTNDDGYLSPAEFGAVEETVDGKR